MATRAAAVIGLIATLVAFVWWVRRQVRLSHAFGKSTGFGVGLVVLPNIFALIVTFGSAAHEGPEV